MPEPGSPTADPRTGSSIGSSIGCSVALLALYDTHVERVFSYFLRRCGDRAVAEELTSETFLGALQSLRTCGPRQPELSWLLGVARHKLVDHWRRRERNERAVQALASAPRADPSGLLPTEVGVATHILGHLPAHYRLVLTLRYLDDLPLRDIAASLECSEHAAESLLARARRAFRAAYDDQEGAS